MSDQINGVDADFWNESKVPTIIGINTFFIVLAFSSVAFRFYARKYAGTGVWWDDWFALATVVSRADILSILVFVSILTLSKPFAVSGLVINMIQTKYNFGRHQIVAIKTDPGILVHYARNLYILLLAYNPSLAFFKYSFLALYIRIFPYQWLRKTTYALGVLITLWVLGTELLIALGCTPVKAYWIPNAGTCVPQSTIIMVQCIPTIFFDVTIIVLPLKLVWRVQMARSDKIGVTITFLLGGIVTIISCLRLAFNLRSSNADLTWGYVDLGLISSIEPVVGLVCCCIPAYSPLLRSVLRNCNLGSTRHSSKPTNSATARSEELDYLDTDNLPRHGSGTELGRDTVDSRGSDAAKKSEEESRARLDSLLREWTNYFARHGLERGERA